MRTSVRLPQCHCHLRDGSFAICVQELRSVRNNAAVLLLGTAEEARNINQSHQRNIEGIAEAYKAGSLA